MGINNMSYESSITNTQYDPDLKPVAFGGTGWVDFRQPDGAHVVVDYNAGHVEVTISGTTDEAVPFGPVVVAAADIPPIWTTEAIVGFSGGTGGANQTLEFDNVVITAKAGTPPVPDPLEDALNSARDRWRDQGELYINSGGPMLACSGKQNPAPAATGDASEGDTVVWLGDNVGGGALSFFGEFFDVTPLVDSNGVATTLQVAFTDMGIWDARGTGAGLNDNDSIFHTERWAAMQYDIPAANGDYEVTLYFANSFSGTAGTARRVFHVDLNGERKTDFPHCEFSGKPALGAPTPNPYFSFPELFDPVDTAEQLYAPNPCMFEQCTNNGVIVTNDSDADRILAGAECGNAAASALRYDVTVTGGLITVALTPPDLSIGEPASPDGNPKISGIAIKRKGTVGPRLVRGDTNADGRINITDPIYSLAFSFQGGPPPPCRDAADADDSFGINITDPIYLLSFLFQGGPRPPAPSPSSGNYVPGDCGLDTTADNLDCVSFPPCN